jgi:hypothetical protein
MSSQKLQVTLSATDEITPTTKTIIASLEQFLNQLKLTDAGLTGIQGKMRTAFAATGATQLFPTQQMTQFSAGLAQVGTNLDATSSKVQASTSKFAAFGSALLQNGTAFGVAGASAFGLFNAIDNLEKVQLRASTATLRSTTATTTLASAELALSNAKASGTASTEQIAILEAKVSDARERVAVTTERAAIFQQDYTEALAGLALQVGPQAIAVVGSLATVYQTISQTFAKQGGVINALRTAFAGLSTTQAATAAGAFTMGGAFNSMAESEVVATAATRGLSTAMKGLLISTGIGAVIAVGAAVFETMSAAAEKTDTTVQDLSTSVGDFGTAGTGAVEEVDTGLKTLLQSMTEVENKAKTMSFVFKGSVQEVTQAQAEAARIQQEQLFGANIDPTFQINKLKAAREQIVKGIAQQGKMGFDTTGLQKDVDDIDKKVAKFQATIDLNNKNMAIASAVTAAWDAQLAAAGGDVNKATGYSSSWLAVNKAAVETENQRVKSLEELAAEMQINIPTTVQGSKAMEDYLGKILGFPVATEKATKAEVTYSEALTKARAETQLSNEEAAKMTVAKEQAVAHNLLMTQSLAGEATALATTTGQQQAFNDVIVTGIQGLNDQAIGLHLMADANAVATQQTAAAIQAAGEEVIALTNLGAIYDGSATSLLALTKAKVAGVTSAQQFVTQAELEATTLEANTAALQEFITVNEGIQIPPWITVTPELLKKIQTEIAATGGAFGTLATAMNEAMAPALASIDKLVNAESMKEFKKAFKELPGIEDFSKNTRNALMDIEKDMNMAQTRFKEFGTDWNQLVIGITRGASGKALADLGANLKKDFESFSKIDVTGLTKVFDPVMEFLDGLSGTKLRTEGPKLAGVVDDIMKAFESGQTIDWNEMNSLIIANADAFAKFPDIFSKIVAQGNPSAQAIEAVNTASAKLFALQPPAWLSDPQKNFLGLSAEQIAHQQGQDDTTKDKTAAEVPGPVKATDFDTKKAAIIKEITDIGTTVVAPTAIPAPDATAFTNAMNTLLLIPADFTARFNQAFVGLVVPAPTTDAFAAGLKGVVDQAALAAQLIIASFSALTIPAPITDTFVTGIGKISEVVLAVNTDMSVLSTPLVIPAPNTDAFTGAFDTLATDVVGSLQEIVDFVADDLTTSFADIDETISGDVTDAFDTLATDATDSLQEIVDFLNDDMVTGFENMGEAGTQAGSDVSSAMDDIGSAASSAESEVQSLISALNSIPTDITVTIHIKVVGDPSGGVKGGAEGYHGLVDEPTVFLAGEKGEERVDIKPLSGPDTAGFKDERSLQMIPDPGKLPSTPVLTPYTYSQPPATTGNPSPIIANITIPVYVNGQYQGTQQTTKILRDMGAFLG